MFCNEVFMLKRFWATIILFLLGACTGSNNNENALMTEVAIKGTEIEGIRQTATAEADRMLITVEHAQTEISFVQAQGTYLASTLVATGFDLASISNLAPIATTPALVGASNPQPTSNLAPITTQEASIGGTPIPVTPFTITPTNPAPPRLSNIVLAEGVGQDDCALNTVTQFTTETTAIYVVATASNVQPGTTITSRWQSPLNQQVAFDFKPDFYIEEGCVWFFIEPVDFDSTALSFSAGSWTVSLEINGQAVGAPLPFTVLDLTSG
jgi:hypothetical protein